MPTYQIKRWSTKNFDIHSVPLVEQAYNARKWAFAADYIRVYALYTEGGVYFDSDVMLYGSLERLLDAEFVSGVEYHPSFEEKQKNIDEKTLDNEFRRICETKKVYGIGIQAAVLASVQRHPLMKKCIEFYKGYTLDNLLVEHLTAPTVLAYNAEEWGYAYNDCEQNLESSIHLYPTKIISNYDQKGKNSVVVHYCAGSWTKKTIKSRVTKTLSKYKLYRLMRDPVKRILNKNAKILNIPNITYTLRHDLCTGCGVCEGACPAGAIKTVVRDGRFLPEVDGSRCKNKTGCHRCHDVCPGLGVDLTRIARERFADAGIKEDRLAGRYLKCFAGHSNEYEIRYHCASGGMVSQFLIFLLERGYIDGAVVTAFDAKNELLVRSYIARTREEVLNGKGSKYAPVSLHGVAQEIRKAEGSRYVIVGLPCHIHGFRKLEAVDKRFREKVAGYFGIYCSSGRTFYLTEHVLKERGIKKEELEYFAYRDEGCLGSMVAKGIRATSLKPFRVAERYQSYYHPLRSFFIPRRCLFCIDHYAELGDVCFGDIHIEPYSADKVGVSSIVVRKQRWLDWLEEARTSGSVTLEEIGVETLNASQKMAYKKKGRNAEFVALNKKLGRAVPKYDTPLPKKTGLKALMNYMQNRGQQFLGRHKRLWWLVSMLKKDTSNLE